MMLSVLVGFFLILGVVRSEAMVGGKTDHEGRLHSVVYFADLHCSGVKITRHAYLTAAHCVNSRVPSGVLDFADQSSKDRKFRIKNQSSKNRTVHLRKISLHPSWRRVMSSHDDSSAVDQKIKSPWVSDLAVIEIQEDTSYPVAQIFFQTLPSSSAVIITGFGVKDDFGRGIGEGLGFEINPFAKFRHQFMLLDSRVSSGKLISIRSGDSGSPGFLQVGKKELFVVGINSYTQGTTAAGRPHEFFALTRLDSSAGIPHMKNWICTSWPLVRGCLSRL